MPRVKLPPPYRGPTHGLAVIEVDASTLRECIEAVERLHPGVGELILDAGGALQKFVTLFIDGDEVARGDLDICVAADSEVEVLAAIAGG